MPVQINFRGDIAKMHGLSMEQVLWSAFRFAADKAYMHYLQLFAQVCAGSGSDDILDIIMRLVDADSCIISPPTFGMCVMYLSNWPLE